MANYAADSAGSTTGTQLTVRTGTASADTVPAGSYVVWQNTGAGTHIVTLTNGFVVDTGTAPSRTITMGAGQFWGGRINGLWGNASGVVPVGIDGTPSEVKYMIIGGV